MASEYSWSKQEIFYNVYPDELDPLLKFIKKRRIRNLKDQLAIVQNPFTPKPKDLFDELDRQDDKEVKEAEFDPVGFEILKTKMRAAGSKMVVKD